MLHTISLIDYLLEVGRFATPTLGLELPTRLLVSTQNAPVYAYPGPLTS